MSEVILFVCTANLCRSPLAQALAVALSGARAGAPPATGAASGTAAEVFDPEGASLRFASAGTAAIEGLPVHPFTAVALERRGLDMPGFSSGLLGPQDVHEAALIVTATREHRAHCVRMLPSANRRCFTLRQLSRLATVIDQDGLAVAPSASTAPGPAPRIGALLDAIPAARGRIQPVAAVDDDLADPVMAGQEAFHACAQEIARLLEPIVRLIATT